MMIPFVNAELVVLDFEDLPGITGYQDNWPVPQDYVGLTWDPHWFYATPQAPFYYPYSGDYVIGTYNYGGWFKFNEDVYFHGAYFTGGICEYTEDFNPIYPKCRFQGYLDGVLVGESEWLEMHPTPTFLNANFGSLVDKVNLECDQLNHVGMDDLTYETDWVPPAPEFGSLAVAAAILLTAPAFAYLLVKRRA
ncbi:MAG: hypothetical protein JW724_00170 [Candidatus Altiarchaeota archaeon]|nr:hypothetical protein [Candidatus Altiarchaeota archaeon]